MRKKASSSAVANGAGRNRASRERASEPRVEAEAGGGLLVVVELGGTWPSPAATNGGPRRVLAQLEGETPAAFAERVAHELDGLFGRGVRLETMVLACNERLDGAAEAARRKALGLALGSMAKHGSGRVYVAASERSSGRLRHALSALALGLFEEWRTAGLEALVDFGQETTAKSGAAEFTLTSRVA